MTTRRGFLTGMLALGAAPAIVRAESLMRIWVPPQEVLTLDTLRRAKAQLLVAHIDCVDMYLTMLGSNSANPIIHISSGNIFMRTLHHG